MIKLIYVSFEISEDFFQMFQEAINLIRILKKIVLVIQSNFCSFLLIASSLLEILQLDFYLLNSFNGFSFTLLDPLNKKSPISCPFSSCFNKFSIRSVIDISSNHNTSIGMSNSCLALSLALNKKRFKSHPKRILLLSIPFSLTIFKCTTVDYPYIIFKSFKFTIPMKFSIFEIPNINKLFLSANY